MKRRIQYFLFLFVVLFAIAFNSCETEFDVIADYEDITIVYALFDPTETVHYVKINKAFLGEGNALIMAQNQDSCNYELGLLEVKLEEWNGSSKIRDIYFDTTTVYNKESGIFYYPEQIVFMANATLNHNYSYNLVITNTETGKIVSAETDLVHPIYLQKPNPGANSVGYTSTYPGEVKWISCENGRVYQFLIKFKYKEINISTNDTTSHYVDWSFGTQTAPDLEGGDEMIVTYYGETFFQILANSIPVTANVKRIDDGVEYYIYSGGDDLNIYIEMNKPSNTIVQERPEYTNVSNGIGIVSTRSSVVYPFDISQDTRTELVTGNLYHLTDDLNFVYN